MKSQLEQDLLKVFEAGKKCMEEHSDDDSYDTVHFDRVLKELSPETSKIISEARKPFEVKEAEKYIAQCSSDMGFMGSYEYDKQKKIVESYYEPIRQLEKEQEERASYLRLKSKFES